MLFSDVLKNQKLERVKFKMKILNIYGVNIKISPNLIYRVENNGKKVIGALKVHLSKGKPFTHRQSALVAQLLHQYLSNFANEDEIVDPQLCICIDPFAGTTISASNKIKLDMKEIKLLCKEIPIIWDQVNNNRSSDAA